MRFVRVPLMKVGQIGPTFLVPEKTVNFFRVKPAVSSFTLKMRKSHKKLARVYAYTHAYTQIRDGGGQICPPPGNNRVKSFLKVCLFKFLFATIVQFMTSMGALRGAP